MMHVNPTSYEAQCRAHAREIHQRLMNPKNGIKESKIARPREAVSPPPEKPRTRKFLPEIPYETALEIKEQYYAGVPVITICARFSIVKRTVTAIRYKYGWPVREKVR